MQQYANYSMKICHVNLKVSDNVTLHTWFQNPSHRLDSVVPGLCGIAKPVGGVVFIRQVFYRYILVYVLVADTVCGYLQVV